jgi:hypothetical protein
MTTKEFVYSRNEELHTENLKLRELNAELIRALELILCGDSAEDNYLVQMAQAWPQRCDPLFAQEWQLMQMAAQQRHDYVHEMYRAVLLDSPLNKLLSRCVDGPRQKLWSRRRVES